MIEMIMVTSSNIEAIGYDPDVMELRVRFLQSGATYSYAGVPDWVFDEFRYADSIGSYFNRNIKGSYNYTTV